MNTETNDIINETPEDINKKKAMEFVHSNPLADVIDHLAFRYSEYENLKESNRVLRGRLQEMVDAVTDFAKCNMKDGADSDDIAELCEKLDIELTKELTVSFTANVEVTLTVPIDFDEESIHDGMFNVSVESNYRNDKIEWDNDSIEIDDFDVSENN